MQQFYQEAPRQIPIAYSVDVLVVGSGPAGFAAAVNAARQGAKTLLVEALGNVGGIATSGLMSHFTGSVGSDFYEELLSRMAMRNEGDLRGKRTITIDPEQLKTLCLEMLAEAGAQLLLYTMAVDVIMEGNAVKGVIIENKGGRPGHFGAYGDRRFGRWRCGCPGKRSLYPGQGGRPRDAAGHHYVQSGRRGYGARALAWLL